MKTTIPSPLFAGFFPILFLYVHGLHFLHLHTPVSYPPAIILSMLTVYLTRNFWNRLLAPLMKPPNLPEERWRDKSLGSRADRRKAVRRRRDS